MSAPKSYPCASCGAPANTRVSWPPMRVRWHWRCDKCWQSWWLMCTFVERWFDGQKVAA